MRYLLLFVVVVLAGCHDPLPPSPKYDPDQTARRVIFQECLKAVPAGPQATKYNDWSEVVEECGSQAYYQSLRCVANCPAWEAP